MFSLPMLLLAPEVTGRVACGVLSGGWALGSGHGARVLRSAKYVPAERAALPRGGPAMNELRQFSSSGYEFQRPA